MQFHYFSIEIKYSITVFLELKFWVFYFVIDKQKKIFHLIFLLLYLSYIVLYILARIKRFLYIIYYIINHVKDMF